ncbi:hypothetical protein OV450_8514 [Actinobacteria bacterium OV450]|nr:hypothetical protein OV450_8514 [Actinobacteria bacterium OV450]
MFDGIFLSALTAFALAFGAPVPMYQGVARVNGCPGGWGTLQKASPATEYKPLVNVRTGRHDCYDRMVFDVSGVRDHRIGYQVKYVSKLFQDGSGRRIKVTGGAILEIRISAPSYSPSTGEPTYPAKDGRTLPNVNLAGYRTFRDARFASSFEGDTLVGLGVRTRLPFRVFQLGGRIVVDVAHDV